MRRLRAAEITIGSILIAVAVFLHVDLHRHVGPLWRDEIVSLHISQAPFGPALDRFQFESFPAFWILLLRGWVACFGSSLGSLRAAGFVTGVLLLAAIVGTLRTLGIRVPMLAFALAASSATVIRYGDSLRAYGFGAVIGLLSLAAIYRTVIDPRISGFVLALVVSLASVHTTYYDCVLLFACCVAAAMVHLTRRNIRAAVITMLLGAVCAASMLIYLHAWQAAGRWSEGVRYSVDFLWVIAKLLEAISGSERFWIVALLAALVLGAAALRGVADVRIDEKQRAAMLYCFLVLVIFIAGDLLFLRLLQYLMQPWYFLLLIVVAAVLIDAIVAMALEQHPAIDLFRGVAALLIVLFTFIPTRRVLNLRSTDMDRIADVVSGTSTGRDLVVVYPWHLGVSFGQYYRGRAPWQTLPPVSDHSVHRYDLAREAMANTQREDALFARVEATLRSGGRLWLVGFPLYYESGAYLNKPLHPAGKVDADLRWSSRFLDVVRRNAHHAVVVVPADPDVAEHERATLTRLTN